MRIAAPTTAISTTPAGPGDAIRGPGTASKTRRQSTAKPETGFVRIEKVGFVDSPLEEGVYCELVSESEISEVSIPVRFWAILVS